MSTRSHLGALVSSIGIIAMIGGSSDCGSDSNDTAAQPSGSDASISDGPSRADAGPHMLDLGDTGSVVQDAGTAEDARADASNDSKASIDGNAGDDGNSVDSSNTGRDATMGDASNDVAVLDAGCQADAFGPNAQLVSVSGTVYRNEDGSPIGGAAVSVEDSCPPVLTTTGAEDGGNAGGYQLTLPLGLTAFLRASTPDALPFIRGFVVPQAGTVQDYYVASRATMQQLTSAIAAFQADPNKGWVWVSFENASVAGYGATISASHGGSLALNAASTALEPSSTTEVGDVDHWFLLFPNVDVGTTTIALTTPSGHHCTPRQAITNWLSRADAVMYYEADCD